MADSILLTKLHAPRLRENIISRPRLTQKLLSFAEQGGGILLVSGPAGFGKTTLLSQLVVEYKQPVAWISLDEGDNDPIRFWTYVITACQSVQADIGQAAVVLLHTPQYSPDESIQTLLINDLDSLDQNLLLILDDYHIINNPSIHKAISFLLDHLPDRFHLVIGTRLDPPWPLARLRARGRLVEVRAADLRFTTEEAADFLNQAIGLDLSARDIEVLEERTEGWIASLQLAAISMKGRKDIAGFIKTFAGSHTYVAEYLVQEVLAHQPEPVRTFLLKTSILSRMNASLCEAVSGRSDAQDQLKELNQANLFILPLDEETEWFRYHHLFADLLQARLRQSLPKEDIYALHQRAAAWYEQADMPSEAMEHTLAAADYSHAVRILEKISIPMIFQAYFKTVADWLQRIPSEFLNDSPRVHMAFAWMHLLRRNPDKAAAHLDYLQTLFSNPGRDMTDVSLDGQWLAIQSMLLNGQGKAAESCALAEQALQLLPEAELQLRSITYMSLANTYQQILDYERAAKACEMIIHSGRLGGDIATEMFGLSLLGRMYVMQGKLHLAYQLVTAALQRIELTNSFSPFSATLYGELAQVHFHWHQLDEAYTYFSKSAQWSNLGGFIDAEIYHSVFLSRLFQMKGDLPASLQEIEKALQLMQTAAPAVVGEEVVAQQVSIYLATDRLSAAQTALKAYGFSLDAGFSYPDLTPDASLSHTVGLLYNSALRVLLHQSKRRYEHETLQSGIELANSVIQGATRSTHLPIMLQALLLRAQLYVAQKNDAAGLKDMAQAVELAEPEKFISLFVQEGTPIATLLTAWLAHHRRSDLQTHYVEQILAAFPEKQSSSEEIDRTALPATRAPIWVPVDEGTEPVEPLTAREMEVLQHIAAGESNQQIANQLVITLSAVKKHTGNIFNKLTVNSRTQAIARARQLGLLSAKD